MCATSYVSDYARDNFPNRYPGIFPNSAPPMQWPNQWPTPALVDPVEFQKLKAEVVELRKLLEAAKLFDDKTGQHECEQDEKVAFLKKLAKFVGVDLVDVLTKPKGG